MKVAINAKHGGFTLSADGLKRYIELGGTHVSTYENEGWPGSPELQNMHNEAMAHLIDVGDGFSKVKNPGLFHEPQLYKDGVIYGYDGGDEYRNEPALIQTIEEMGGAAGTRLSDLKIVEIPDGVEFQIEEYDGLEWVAEKHRVWP